MSRGTASLGIVFPDGKQRNNTGKMCFLLAPRSGLLCSVGTHTWLSLLILTPLCQSHPLGWWLVPHGVSSWRCLSFSCAVGSSTGGFALAGLTLLDQLSEIPGLPRRCQRRVLQTSC